MGVVMGKGEKEDGRKSQKNGRRDALGEQNVLIDLGGENRSIPREKKERMRSLPWSEGSE